MGGVTEIILRFPNGQVHRLKNEEKRLFIGRGVKFHDVTKWIIRALQ